MRIQITKLVKGFVMQVIIGRLRLRAYYDMTVQISNLREFFATKFALKGLFPCMGPGMIIQLSDLYESPVTKLALIWLFSSMDSHVVIQVDNLGKSLVTKFALVWLFSRVDSSMQSKRIVITQYLVTHLTAV